MFTILEGRIARSTYGGLSATESGAFLLLDGEITTDVGECNAIMSVVKSRIKIPVDKPFESWEALIDAVKADTPQADKIIKYLEEWGYHDILKRKRQVLLPDKKTTAYEWVNFLLTYDELDKKNTEVDKKIKIIKMSDEFKNIPANPNDAIDEKTPRNEYMKKRIEEITYKNPADYNRKMFYELRKYAPRTQMQTVQIHSDTSRNKANRDDPDGYNIDAGPSNIFGGKLLNTGGATQQDMQRKLAPAADYIVKSNRDNIMSELDDMFSTLTYDWKKAALGEDFKNVRYAKDDAKVGQLQSPIETLSSKDAAELERLRRTYELLIKRSANAGFKPPADKEAYYMAIKDVEAKMKAISNSANSKGLSVFIKIAISLDDFLDKLSEEVKDVAPNYVGEEAPGLQFIQTSLKGVGKNEGINKLVSYIDPVKAETEIKYKMKPIFKQGDEDKDHPENVDVPGLSGDLTDDEGGSKLSAVSDVEMVPKARKVKMSSGSMGFMHDLFKLFEDVIGGVISKEIHINRISNAGIVFFTTDDYTREYVDVEPGEEPEIKPQATKINLQKFKDVRDKLKSSKEPKDIGPEEIGSDLEDLN